ncbi:MAG: V-type ATP synthase subunit E [Candidatus Edwardsbacteria bacterium]|nr:V-type ATP synthase subunit E [Candidatus Edwardsbacteria bacterium]MBU1576653.1 V-type ATP synthase subunit E [Candidatus Edwardsbacteria bacterium]MBU2462687.1 V-type ATP synthase subunit E [Candidatus Edwardsbacteria bacterium]MBU2594481.1 V-type ATP synthase subunit E [Candidatus Edwardsbacteria bacterium]
MNSELIKVIEREAEAERQRILDASRKNAGEIIEQAKAQAAELEQKFQADSQSLERTEMAKANSAANLQAMAILLEVKSRIIDGIFQAAYQKIKKMPQEKYRQALKSMLQEAVADLPGETVVLTSPGDLKMVQEIVKAAKLKAEVKPDPQVQEGIIMSDKSGSHSVLNRFSDRMERARPSLVAHISETLWG